MKEPSIEEQLKDARAEKAENGALGDGRNLVVYYEDAIKALIQSERRKAAIEAKITELENIHGWWTHGDNDLEPKNLLHRIKDLKATLQDKKEK